MASANLIALQKTLNRFSGKAGFTPIVPDGGMGILTASATNKAIGFVASGGGVFDFGLSDSSKSAASSIQDGIAGAVLQSESALETFIMQQNVLINTVLTQAASELGLPAAVVPAAPNTLVGGGGGPLTSLDLGAKAGAAPGAGGQGSVIDTIGAKLGLSSTQTLLFLAMLGGVGFLAVKRMQTKGARAR